MKLLDRLWLKWYGFCTKHVVLKELYGLDPESSSWLCPKCEEEADKRFNDRLERIRNAPSEKTLGTPL